MKKRAIAIIVVIGLGLAALIISSGLVQQIANRGATNTTQMTTNTAGTGAPSKSFLMGMNVIPTAGMVPLGGRANFTVAFYNAGDITGDYSLSVAGPSGLSFEFNPSPVNLSGCRTCVALLRVHSSSTMEAGTYQVTINAAGPRGLANHTFDFHVQRNLVLLTGSDIHQFTDLTLKVGDTVTWLSLDGPFSDEDYGFHQVIFLDSTVSSGSLLPNQSWSHTFAQPGVYRYYDNALPTITGIITVTA